MSGLRLMVAKNGLRFSSVDVSPHNHYWPQRPDDTVIAHGLPAQYFAIAIFILRAIMHVAAAAACAGYTRGGRNTIFRYALMDMTADGFMPSFKSRCRHGRSKSCHRPSHSVPSRAILTRALAGLTTRFLNSRIRSSLL